MYIYKIVAVFSVFHGNLLNFFSKATIFVFWTLSHDQKGPVD